MKFIKKRTVPILFAIAITIGIIYEVDPVKSLRQILQKYQIEEIPSIIPKYELAPPVIKIDNSSLVNLPLPYLNNRLKKPSSFNKTCGKYPDLFQLKWEREWQIQQTSNGTFHLFNAYLDDRKFNKNGPVIRITTILGILNPNQTYFCQIWYNNTLKPGIAVTEIPSRMWVKGWGGDKNGFNNPYMVSCELPIGLKDQVPLSVSLVEDPCESATNNLKIFYDVPEKEKKDFIVCVKGLYFAFDDRSARLVEWIELIRLLGANKINFYEIHIHPNMKKVLTYYENQGLVEVTPITVVGGYPNHPSLQDKFLNNKITEKLLQEPIHYNDCLYRHLYQYKYVVLLDTDEVIMPVTGTWKELIKELQKFKKATSYMARNVYFLDIHHHEHDWFKGVPKYMHMLQHIARTQNYTKRKECVKGFHKTESVKILHNHFPIQCGGRCNHYGINVALAHLQHYRGDCVSGGEECENMKLYSVLDARVWNFRDELIEKTTKVLKDLGFLKNRTLS